MKTMKQNRESIEVVPRKHELSVYSKNEGLHKPGTQYTFRHCQSMGSWAGISENPHISEIELLIAPTALLSITFGKRTKH